MESKYPTLVELQEIFEYVDGELWRKAYTNTRNYTYPRKLVENIINTHYGYCQVKFKNRMVKYHAIVWILNKGDVPREYVFDHIDGNRTNNNISNLRVVTKRENNRNKIWNREGRLVGGYYNKRQKKWVAQVKIDGKSTHLGIYSTELEAHQAYLGFFKKEMNCE